MNRKYTYLVIILLIISYIIYTNVLGNSISVLGALLVSPVFLFIFWIVGKLTYFIEINDEKLIIKNVIFFWLKKEHTKTDIKDIYRTFQVGESEDGDRLYFTCIGIETYKDYTEYRIGRKKNYITLDEKLKKFKYSYTPFYGVPLKLEIKNINRKFDSYFSKMSDEELIQTTSVLSDFKSILHFILSFFVVPALLIYLFCFDHSTTKSNDILFISITILSPFLAYSLYCICFYLIFGDKKVKYNRKNGTITYPLSKYNRKTITIPFKELKLYKNIIPYEKNNVGCLETREHGVWVIHDGYYGDDFLSYIVWYMDKNRPLPYGDKLNKYRKRDFERRKKEGFPSPIYESKMVIFEDVYEYQKIQYKLTSPKITTYEMEGLDKIFQLKTEKLMITTKAYGYIVFDRVEKVILIPNSKNKNKMKGYYFQNLKIDAKNNKYIMLKRTFIF